MQGLAKASEELEQALAYGEGGAEEAAERVAALARAVAKLYAGA